MRDRSDERNLRTHGHLPDAESSDDSTDTMEVPNDVEVLVEQAVAWMAQDPDP